MVVHLIGGPADGMEYEYFTIPDKIIMPCLPYFPLWNKFSEETEMAISQVVYQRVADTLEFICISKPKGE